MGEEANRLIEEESPYLQQHAHNPVDWYPWGEEAFEKARKEDKPIFLSIGYSTCHWCHVMAHESFEDKKVAELINDTFVPIKVDREERPDIDGVYMRVAMSMTGSGGWPLTIFMTPDKEPFFASTYIPKESRYGRTGLMQLIPRVKELWESEKDKLVENGKNILRSVGEDKGTHGDLKEEHIRKAFTEFASMFDEEYGGFGTAPKFPSPHNLLFLTDYFNIYEKEKAINVVQETLDAMRNGGIYDHIGKGFHRYSTDRGWVLPHFEKMLYDQAMHMMAYSEAYIVTREDRYKKICEEILDYLKRDMRSSKGGFYSAEDADTEGVEGKFYTWTEEEIDDVLGDGAELFKEVYHVSEDGNFREESTGKKTGENILYTGKNMVDRAEEKGMDVSELEEKLSEMRTRLMKAREKRNRPERDDKILTNWNGLVLAALSRCYLSIGEEDFLETAVRTADFLIDRMVDDDNTLLHRYKDGKTAVKGNLEDYAFLSWGLLELYRATLDVEYLKIAVDLTNKMIEIFWDEDDGGFYFAEKGAEDVPLNFKEVHDGASPSGNSVALMVLAYISNMTGEPKYQGYTDDLVEFFGGKVALRPSQYSMFMYVFSLLNEGFTDIVVAGEPEDQEVEDTLELIRKEDLAGKIVLHKHEKNSEKLADIAPFTEDMDIPGEGVKIYICRNFTCSKPVEGEDELPKKLDEYK